MKNYRTIIVTKKDGIGVITLNRPEVFNAINQELIEDMRDALSWIDLDEEILVLIITGAGKGFQAGADIREVREKKPLEMLRWCEGLLRMNAAVEKLRQPVIAAIHGVAMGGGLELAISCQIRIAEEGSRLGLPEVKLGILAGVGGTQRLPRIVGKGRAYEMILTGEPIDAAEGYRIGLINKVVSRGEALKAAEDMARKIINNGPIAVELSKDSIEIGLDLPLEQGTQYSQKNCIMCFTTEDMKEGTAAFIEKRKACFKGR
ncbi:MAG: enoyl-CoA hydratase-related protein [Syntrophales bacterium]|jgi:enoyl-CoA hydratase/carnithine racemase